MQQELLKNVNRTSRTDLMPQGVVPAKYSMLPPPDFLDLFSGLLINCRWSTEREGGEKSAAVHRRR